jgi:AraC-like DNA-binding protein
MESATHTRLRRAGLLRAQAPAFAFPDDLHNIAYDWHQHAYRQLLYSLSGITKLETRDHVWLLPPQRAAWIPAGLRHRTTLSRVRSGSIYFDPRRFRFPGLCDISVFTATPLLREMILHGMRWTNRPRRGDALAENFFRTLALYCRELAQDQLPYQLPRGESPGVRAAIDFTLENLVDAAFVRAARKAGLSVRSLRRHFLAETGITWRQFLTRARLLRAMEILAGKKRNVTETAYACGFTNLSAFSKAFAQFTGENPNTYRRARASAT